MVRNTSGEISPQKAAELARQKNIKVYTIGIGSDQPYTATERMPNGQVIQVQRNPDFDPSTLKMIAERTRARYFHAEDKDALRKVYKEIDLLETTDLEANKYKQYEDLFHWFILIALILYGLGFILPRTIFNTIP